MLELRPSCEHCARPLPPDALDARICSFECTFCARCTDTLLAGVCPNCTGELVTRPVRPATLLDGAPPSEVAVHSPVDEAAHRQMRSERDDGADHAGVVLRRYADAWRRGDLAELIDCYAAEFTLHYGGRSSVAGVHRGRDAALAAMAEVSALAPRTLLSVDAVLSGEREGTLVVTEVLERDGERAEVQRSLQYRVHAGLLTDCHLFEHDRSVVDHFWR
jgi:ketosteroid isomerase-like protein